MAAPSQQPRQLAALAALLLAGACLVPDVELVDMLPGAAGAASGGNAGSSSSGASSDGGDETAAGGDAGGSSSSGSGGGSGSNQGGTPNPGGSAGMNPGGSAGMNQGGSNNPVVIPDLQLCPDPNYEICENFDVGQPSGAWTSDAQGTPPLTGTAPSGDSVLITPYQPVQLQLPYDSINISFWVRVSDLPDQRILSFFSGGQYELGLGIESARLRWLMAPIIPNPTYVVAPTADDLTVQLKSATWYCMEVRLSISGGTEVLNARLVEPGKAAFDLPVLDHDPTFENDEDLNISYPGWFTSSDFLIFGDEGSRLELDDVMVGLPDTPTLCDRYLEQL
jgi:hypothetical protein